MFFYISFILLFCLPLESICAATQKILLLQKKQQLELKNTSLALVAISTLKLAELFLKDHSPEMIEALKTITPLEKQKDLSLRILTWGGALQIFREREEDLALNFSLLTYEQLAYILDIYAEAQLKKVINLQFDLEHSFDAKIWQALVFFVVRHNQTIFLQLVQAQGDQAVVNGQDATALDACCCALI